MTPQQQPDAATHYHPVSLLDVLAEIPLDATEANIWGDLAPPDRRSLRQACQRSRQLADELVQSAAFDIHYTAPPEPEAAEGEEEQQVDPQIDAASFEAWHQAVEVRAAYLARLPRLRSLEVNSWSSEADLLVALLRLGGAASRSGADVTRLELCGADLSLSSGCALRVAFPRLQELTLRNKLPVGQEESLDLTGAMFLPLRDLPLTKLVVDNRDDPQIYNTISAEALRSLRDLPRLQHLSLAVDAAGRPELQALSALTHLTHLSVKAGRSACPTEAAGPFELTDLAGLFTLPNLAFLRLPALDNNNTTLPPAAPPPSMRTLTRLRSLQFGSYYVIRDALFAEVCQLTRLTMLKCGRLALACPTPGHLPALQHLRLQDCLRPHDLLQTLLPLLPLPSLTALDSTAGRLCVSLSLADHNGDCGTSAAGQVAALAAASQHLAAAPCLRLRQLALMESSAYASLPLAQVAEGLGPLGPHLTRLHCYHMKVEDEAGWSALSTALPRLLHLTLSCGSTTTAGGLAALCTHWPGLQRLDCGDVVGLSTGEEEAPAIGVEECLSAGALLGLAVARSHALLVVLYPAPEAGVVGLCRAVQQAEHGRWSIVWATRARYCSDDSYTAL